MILRQSSEAYERLDAPTIHGETSVAALREREFQVDVHAVSATADSVILKILHGLWPSREPRGTCRVWTENRKGIDPMEITIRPAVAQDYDELCQLMGEVDALHRDHLPHIFRRPGGPAREQAYIRGLISNREAGLLVAEVDGQLVGFVSLVLRDAPPIPIFVPRKLAVVDSLAVRVDHRRAGIGRALMEESERWAAAHQARTIELNVYEFNRSAIAFYKALGYRSLSRRLHRGIAAGKRPEGDEG